MLPGQPVMNVYPNPSSDIVYCDISLEKPGDGEVAVYDLLGNRVYIKTFENSMMQNLEMDFSALARGVYFISLTTGDKVVTQKLILN